MTIYDKFARRVIELIYGCEYCDAIGKELRYGCRFLFKKEWDDEVLTFLDIYDDTHNTLTFSYLSPENYSHEENNFTSIQELGIELLGLPITLSRVLQALNNKPVTCISYRPFYKNKLQFEYHGKLLCTWKLLKYDRSTATHEDQEEETIEKLYELLK